MVSSSTRRRSNTIMIFLFRTLLLLLVAPTVTHAKRHSRQRNLPKNNNNKNGGGVRQQRPQRTHHQRNLQSQDRQCAPPGYEPVDQVEAILTSLKSDCVYYIDHDTRFELPSRKDMECVGDVQPYYSGGKKSAGDDYDEARQRRRNVRKTRRRGARKLQDDHHPEEEEYEETTVKELSMDTCNFNLEDDVSTGLILSPLDNNVCVNGATIKALCYGDSAPDLVLLCPQDCVAYAGNDYTIEPRASFPSDDYGAASSSSMAGITPTQIIDGAQHYDILVGCANVQCYEAALEECFGDQPFVEEGTCDDGENALSFRIKGCTPNGQSAGPNNWEARLFGADPSDAEEEDLCTNAADEKNTVVSKIEYTITTANTNDAPSIEATVLRTDGDGNPIPGLGDADATDGVLSIDPWNAIPTGDTVLCNQLEVQIRDICGTSDGDALGECGEGSAVELTNFSVDGVDLPTVSFSTLTTADPPNTLEFTAEKSFCVKKLSGDFTNSVITGLLNAESWRGSADMRLDIRLVCVEMMA